MSAAPAHADVLSRGWSRHGHPLAGLPQRGERPLVMRCGGRALCKECAEDHAATRGVAKILADLMDVAACWITDPPTPGCPAAAPAVRPPSTGARTPGRASRTNS